MTAVWPEPTRDKKRYGKREPRYGKRWGHATASGEKATLRQTRGTLRQAALRQKATESEQYIAVQ